jgi:transcriptional regulator GlxA family with amidase domain
MARSGGNAKSPADPANLAPRLTRGREISLPLKRIARDCGFGSEQAMRHSFLRLLAVPPHAYRERFPV